MRRSCVVAVALLLAIDLWAGEPWKQKSHKVWNQNDVRKILNESPLAKRIEVEGDPTKHAGMESPENGGTSESAAGEESDEGGGREQNDRAQMTFVVRWVSSRTTAKHGSVAKSCRNGSRRAIPTGSCRLHPTIPNC